ncbi:sortilin-related receptor-like isoform X2 [Corticium candelabrum]|nr:sortilin-related receptor-like isoform X2 [Corticium candelabrum]XP_062521991.1 sortilin-related receptor-like isoform X2 [Corticium candelabrum]XP_062521997.1 sortilin-related receptor-like isoform X2 [Corticium candelabrum]XP_062522004.1 sortilin-related receptor-like isoform X2 [Corticium candelabrum]
MFFTKDDCVSFKPSKVSWSPTVLVLHPTLSDVIAAMSTTSSEHFQLRVTTDYGSTWKLVMSDIKTFYWGVPGYDSNQTAYVEKWNSDGKTSNVLRIIDLLAMTSFMKIASNVLEFEVFDDYMFAVTNSTHGESLSLLVSHKRNQFTQALFPPDANGKPLLEREYYVADSSEEQAFVAVNHASNHTNLYISAAAGHKFSLSLERILYYNGQSDVSTPWLRQFLPIRLLDFHRVASLRGVYMSTQLERGLVGQRHFRTVITYDKGGEWGYIEAPDYDNKHQPLNCKLPDCSLQIIMQYGQLYPYLRAEGVLSSPSAPGLVMATGLTRSSYGVFLSNTGGATWSKILDKQYFYNFGDHGGVMVTAIKGGQTNYLEYSCDEGLTWKKKNFSDVDILVYGVITEPGEQTTVFSLYGDYPSKREWVIVRIDLRRELGQNCTEKDYTFWHPSDERHDSDCLLGRDISFERRRRDRVCFNGENYDRAIVSKNCSCTREDYECDFDYEDRYVDGICYPVSGTVLDIAVSSSCPASKTYTVSSGYRRVAGDTCIVGDDAKQYEPLILPCPQTVSIIAPGVKVVDDDFIIAKDARTRFSVSVTDPDVDSLLFRWEFGDSTAPVSGQGDSYSHLYHSYNRTGDFVISVSIFSKAPTQYSTRHVSVRNVPYYDRLHLIVYPSPAMINQEVTFTAMYDNAVKGETDYMMYTFGIAEPASKPVVISTNQPVVKHNFTVAETVKVILVADNGVSTIDTQQQLHIMGTHTVTGKTVSHSNTGPIMAGVLSAILAVLLIVFVIVYCKYKKLQSRFARITAADLTYNREEEEGPALLESSDDEDESKRRKKDGNNDDDEQLLVA